MEHPSFPQLHRLIAVVEKLLDPQGGCPWDLKQTHSSLLKYLVEEAYEFIHAVDNGDFPHMEEELGDIFLQVLLHATIADKNGKFSLEGLSGKLSDKLIYRHPHVFKEKNPDLSAEQVLEQWDDLKEKKKKEEGKQDTYQINASLLHFPAILSSYKIGQKSAQLSFDWDDYSQVIYKVEEEWQELKEELPPSGEFNRERAEEEVGDLLFSVVQLSRHLKIDPEEALRKSNRKFLTRFNILEDMLKAKGENQTLHKMSEREKEELWMKAKIIQKENKEKGKEKEKDSNSNRP